MVIGVAVSVGGREVTGSVDVSEGRNDGETAIDGVETGPGVPHAAASKASNVNRKANFFIY